MKCITSLASALTLISFGPATAWAQPPATDETKSDVLRIIVFGAHPDGRGI